LKGGLAIVAEEDVDRFLPLAQSLPEARDIVYISPAAQAEIQG